MGVKKLTLILCVLLSLTGCSLQALMGTEPQPPTAGEDGSGKFPSLTSLEAGAKHSSEILGIFPSAPNSGRIRFVTASANGDVLAWAGDNYSAYKILSVDHAIDKVAYHDPLGYLAVARGTVIQILSVSDGKELYRFNRLGSTALDITFSPDGKSLLIGSANGKVYRWKFEQEVNAKTLKERQTAFERYNGPAVSVASVAFHPNGRVFFSGDWDGGLNGWLAYDTDRYKGEYDRNLFGPSFFSEGAQRTKAYRNGIVTAIDRLQVSDDGNLIFAATQTGSLELYKTRGMVEATFSQPHLSVIYAVAVSPDGSRVATTGRDGRVVVSTVRRFTEKEMLEKIDRTFDHEILLLKEFALPNVRALRFLSNNTLIAGDKSGSVLSLTIDAQ